MTTEKGIIEFIRESPFTQESETDLIDSGFEDLFDELFQAPKEPLDFWYKSIKYTFDKKLNQYVESNEY